MAVYLLRGQSSSMDGAIFHEGNSAGVGIIVRDHEGKVLLSVSMEEHAVMDPMEIELIAILRGLQFCIPFRPSSTEY